jgi:hypothetical protein
MLKIFLSVMMGFGLCSFFSCAQAGVEPQVPAGASWGMTLEQTRQLSELEHDATGVLQYTYEIRGSSQIELVARWQGRAISFYVARDIGLYAINIEMTPQALQRGPFAADQDLLELEQCAPIRQAIMQKYGAPIGLAASWESSEVLPLSPLRRAPKKAEGTDEEEWPYARNVLLWEGQETRLALGEQSVWYVSRLGLAQRERAKRSWEQEQDVSFTRELERRAKRQQQLDDARAGVSSRARQAESLF